MAGAENIVLALLAGEKSGDPSHLPERRKSLRASRDDFVRVSLVTHVPDQRFAGRIENIMKGDCNFNGAETCAEVTAVFQAARENDLADIFRVVAELFGRELLKIGWGANGIGEHHPLGFVGNG